MIEDFLQSGVIERYCLNDITDDERALVNQFSLKYKEIENLVQIFNFDMEPQESHIVQTIVKAFSPIQRYSLKKDGKVVEMTSKINLEKIWR